MNTFFILVSLLLLFTIAHFHRSNRARNNIVHVIDDNCMECRRCLRRCRRKALDIVNNDEGFHITLKYPDKCTACGDCVSVCKFNALEIIRRNREV